MNYLPRLSSNHDLPDLCLLSSQDCRLELLTPSLVSIFMEKKIEAQRE
jgi:hypothetical protein